MDETTFDVLEAASFVHGISLPDIIRPQIDALAQQLARELAIQTALRAREEHRASQAGKLSSLPIRQIVTEDAEA
ncbi:MAG TPA: hypothetical protein VGI24_06590 [Solirubrobacteraceae bacterium]|jgi:hypothetical protein